MVFALLALQSLQPMDIQSKVEAGLKQLTLVEKLECLGGEDSMFTRAIPKLGIPRIRMSDGPSGVRCWGDATAYPAPIAIAASFDTALIRKFGVQIGADSKERDVQILLAPGVNLARVPQNGRNFEYFGEDPFLASRCAVEMIKGVQSQGVAATIKHYVANEHENDRMVDSSNVTEATLRELNFLPFEAAVKEAGVKCVMSGYNRLNGIYASQSDWSIYQILKKEWGFKGVHMSDWGGTHDAIGAALGGLDLEMPSAQFMSVKNLQPAVESGKVPMALIDDKVRRLLTLIYEMGWDKHVPADKKITKENPDSADVSLQIAREGMVLLTNRNQFLPLKPAHRNIIVTGPQATTTINGGGGSAYTNPFSFVTALDAIKKEIGTDGNVQLLDTSGDRGTSIPMPEFSAEYFGNKTLSGEPVATRNEAKISFHLKGESPAPGVAATDYSVRWTNKFTVPASGEYVISMEGDDGYRVFLDGKKVIEDWTDHAATRRKVQVQLEAGKAYEIKIELYQGMGDAVARFGITPVFRFTAELLAQIESADAVVACVGYQGEEGEGVDRSFTLPSEQITLIDQLVERSKNVVLVVYSGGASDLARWADKAAAIIQAWYPGENGNQALAEILTGKTNPSGKLPATFPASLKNTYYESAYPPVNKAIDFKEGVYTGYRWFDREGVAPLFAFGHGLSYSTFAIDRVTATETAITAKVNHVSGPEGATVLQVYVAMSGEAKPFRQLKGFARVTLAPGASKVVTIPLDPRALARWSPADRAWRVEAGRYEVQLGLSSGEIATSLAITVEKTRIVS